MLFKKFNILFIYIKIIFQFILKTLAIVILKLFNEFFKIWKFFIFLSYKYTIFINIKYKS